MGAPVGGPNRIADLERLLTSLAPCGAPMTIREPLQPDEARWFMAGLEAQVFNLQDCPEDCFRRRRWGPSGPDHFVTPTGGPRHLFLKPDPVVAALNREYIPHLAAYSRAILGFGYERSRSSFSFYRTFAKDLIAKRAGQSYETDAEFYDGDDGIHLQIEAKSKPRQAERLAAEMSQAGSLAELPVGTVKEIEYVLDLAPKFLWVVGPGSVDPARYVFEVGVSGMNAEFTPRTTFPDPPR